MIYDFRSNLGQVMTGDGVFQSLNALLTSNTQTVSAIEGTILSDPQAKFAAIAFALAAGITPRSLPPTTPPIAEGLSQQKLLPGYSFKQGPATDPGLANFVTGLESRGVRVLGTNLRIVNSTGETVGE